MPPRRWGARAMVMAMAMALALSLALVQAPEVALARAAPVNGSARAAVPARVPWVRRKLRSSPRPALPQSAAARADAAAATKQRAPRQTWVSGSPRRRCRGPCLFGDRCGRAHHGPDRSGCRCSRWVAWLDLSPIRRNLRQPSREGPGKTANAWQDRPCRRAQSRSGDALWV